ncbi:hypothetical protein NMY22_g9632 [Coprinellus aureogranulatus]|nr:hypothetical protein NMY22_g9632 [Coprinellus aureogranulatus]
MPIPSALNLPPLPQPLTDEVRANVVRSFKLQDNARRRRAAKAAEPEPAAEPSTRVHKLGGDERLISKNNGLGDVNPVHLSSNDSTDSEQIITYGQADAEAMLLSLSEEAYFDSWAVNKHQKFVVYCQDARLWIAICQYVKLKKCTNKPQLKFERNEPPKGELSHRKGKPYPTDPRLRVRSHHPLFLVVVEWLSYLFVLLAILAMCSSMVKFIHGNLTSVLPETEGSATSGLHRLIPDFKFTERITAPTKSFLTFALRRITSALEGSVTAPAESFLTFYTQATLSFLAHTQELVLAFASQLSVKLKISHSDLKRDMYRRLHVSLEALLVYLETLRVEDTQCKDLILTSSS